MTPQAVTANRLGDGQVVYLTTEGAWSDRIERARLAETEDLAEGLLRLAERAVAAHLVVDPYLIKLAVADGGVRPLGRRESIRARGPSVRLDLGIQARAE